MLTIDKRRLTGPSDAEASEHACDEPDFKRPQRTKLVVTSNEQSTVICIEDLIEECIGRGRSGSVYKIKQNNMSLACKLYDTHRAGNHLRMQRELLTYDRLKGSQGTLVPTVHSTVSVDGEVVGICMTLLKSLPWKLSLWTAEDKYKAKGVLLKLADLGLFHEDIKTDNFGLTSDNRMMVFDFEDVTWSEELPQELDVQKFTTRYKKRVCRMFKENK